MDQPATARLSVRAMRRAEVKINGVTVQSRSNRNWKEITSIDVAEHLPRRHEPCRGARFQSQWTTGTLARFNYRSIALAERRRKLGSVVCRFFLALCRTGVGGEESRAR